MVVLSECAMTVSKFGNLLPLSVSVAAIAEQLRGVGQFACAVNVGVFRLCSLGAFVSLLMCAVGVGQVGGGGRYLPTIQILSRW